MKTLVFGIWAFGLPILLHLAKNNPDMDFFAYEKNREIFDVLLTTRQHPHFFSEKTLPENIILTPDPKKILPDVDLLVLVIPNQFIRSTMLEYQEFLKPWVTLLNLSKGINNETLQTVSSVLEEVLVWKSYSYAVLSGGMIASELAEGKKLGAQIAVSTPDIGPWLRSLFSSDQLTINLTDNYKAVELYGALKNIFALYMGYLEGKGYGFSTIGFYFCDLYKEIGALMNEFSAWSNMDFSQYALGWDLIATCFGNSRNRYLGRLVGEGTSLEEALWVLKEEKKHAEGYETLKWLKDIIKSSTHYPILNEIYHIFSLQNGDK